MPFKVTNFGTNRKLMYDFLLVINTNLPLILHRFRDIAFDKSKLAIFGYPLAFHPPRTLQTTDRGVTAYSKSEHEFTFAKNCNQLIERFKC